MDNTTYPMEEPDYTLVCEIDYEHRLKHLTKVCVSVGVLLGVCTGEEPSSLTRAVRMRVCLGVYVCARGAS